MRKVQRGDPLAIPAETFNVFVDTAVAFKRQQRGLNREPYAILSKNPSTRARVFSDSLRIHEQRGEEVASRHAGDLRPLPDLDLLAI